MDVRTVGFLVLAAGIILFIWPPVAWMHKMYPNSSPPPTAARARFVAFGWIVVGAVVIAMRR